MAGMLPGVECARRRRLHQGGVWGHVDNINSHNNKSCRRSPWSISDSSLDLNGGIKQVTRPISEFQAEIHGENKLHEVALLARERLEERLRASSAVNKRIDHHRQRCFQQKHGNTYETSIDHLRREKYVPATKEGKAWLRILSRTFIKEDCPICLECFQLNQDIIHIPCGHKFHSTCLVPWLDKDNHCPYCRAKVSAEKSVPTRNLIDYQASINSVKTIL